MDKETREVVSTGKRYYDLVHSDGWKLVREIFQNKVIDFQSINNLEAKTGTALLQEIRTRKNVCDILLEILREVEGTADQFENNTVEDKPEKDSHIIRIK